MDFALVACSVVQAEGTKVEVEKLSRITSVITGPPRLISHCQNARIGGSGASHCYPIVRVFVTERNPARLVMLLLLILDLGIEQVVKLINAYPLRLVVR